MLLRDSSPRVLLGIGLPSLVLGLVGQIFIHPPSDFWRGFVAGLTGVLIGFSIICNICGLVRWSRGGLEGD